MIIKSIIEDCRHDHFLIKDEEMDDLFVEFL